jgi:hypothetical protein
MSELVEQIKKAIIPAMKDPMTLIEEVSKTIRKPLGELTPADLPQFILNLENSIKKKIEDEKALKRVIRSLEEIKVKTLLSSFSF